MQQLGDDVWGLPEKHAYQRLDAYGKLDGWIDGCMYGSSSFAYLCAMSVCADRLAHVTSAIGQEHKRPKHPIEAFEDDEAVPKLSPHPKQEAGASLPTWRSDTTRIATVCRAVSVLVAI